MRGRALAALAVLAWGAGCREEKPAAPLATLAPAPLPTLAAPGQDGGGEDPGLQPAPAEVFGEALPEKALRLELAGETVRLDGETFSPRAPAEASRLAGRVRGKAVLLVPGADTFLAQTSELLAVLRQAAEAVWLRHPDADVAYRLVLRDEAGFREWLAEVAPGKLRIIQRADGFELSTSVGKLPGGDPNGPSVPVRGGKQDIAMLRRGLGLLKGRFKTAEDLCLVPSFGTELAQAARALSGVYTAPGEPLFETLCLVYPTPAP
ncbi:hypothetical protein SAMN05444354_106224 [Stigmatella aurantiaca]|uniref:Lipoprotein n=1 Tax=Stigmatella aurantiaca TaxID=41 RepID=A0A1H7QPD6_STIAU|nr:hypothetical protein [Stigmatella aurantiaca]SEL49836.1 hypothetical protein SAMN05444354_106224 [Stigmatella aurantiaca]